MNKIEYTMDEIDKAKLELLSMVCYLNIGTGTGSKIKLFQFYENTDDLDILNLHINLINPYYVLSKKHQLLGNNYAKDIFDIRMTLYEIDVTLRGEIKKDVLLSKELNNIRIGAISESSVGRVIIPHINQIRKESIHDLMAQLEHFKIIKTDLTMQKLQKLIREAEEERDNPPYPYSMRHSIEYIDFYWKKATEVSNLKFLLHKLEEQTKNI